jgi:hypothetical protein
MHRINQATRRVKRNGGITEQLHAPAALSMGKKLPGLPGDKLGRPQNRSEQREDNPCSC